LSRHSGKGKKKDAYSLSPPPSSLSTKAFLLCRDFRWAG
jgi:hypothetical protein